MNPENKKPENPKAFPLALTIEHNYAEDGMTLRDYFAAKAMQALISSDPANPFKTISTSAYEIADAMLKQREL